MRTALKKIFARTDAKVKGKVEKLIKELEIIASNDVEKVIDTFNLNLENVALEIKNQETISYLQFHQEEFRERDRV